MNSDSQNVTRAWRGLSTRRRVSYRRYGLNGEHRRPIVHRFDIKGGDTMMDLIKASITQSNPLLRRLMAKHG
jgi:hypothetical protein